MSETTTTEAPKKKGPKAAEKKPAYSKKTLRKMGRDKRKAKLKTDTEFKKSLMERKSKNSTARKLAYRKRHSKGAA